MASSTTVPVRTAGGPETDGNAPRGRGPQPSSYWNSKPGASAIPHMPDREFPWLSDGEIDALRFQLVKELGIQPCPKSWQ